MKKLSSILMIAAVALMVQACGNSKKDSTATADSVNQVKDTTTNGSAGIAVSADDSKFAVDAANGGMTEVQLSQLATAKAVDAQVKEFANMMVMDHSKANEELKGIAKTKNITLPDSINADSKKALDELTKKTGAEFDKAYVDRMVTDHKAVVSLFETGSKNLKDTDLKAFADKTLPVVKGHLDHINKIKSAMK